MKTGHMLWWDGRTGLAHFDGVHAQLNAPPRLGVAITAIDYAPGVNLRMVKEVGQDWRPLTRDEQAALDELLRNMRQAALAVVC